MQTEIENEIISKKQKVKLILLAPLAGGIIGSISFILYLFLTMIMTGVYGRLGFVNFITEFLKLSSLMMLLSFVISYVLGLFILIPTYFFKNKYNLSDNKFWFINCLVTSVLGITVAVAFSNSGPLLVFILFFVFFTCGLFNSSLLTSSINYIVKDFKQREKLRLEAEKEVFVKV